MYAEALRVDPNGYVIRDKLVRLAYIEVKSIRVRSMTLENNEGAQKTPETRRCIV